MQEHPRRLDTSVGVSGRYDFTVRVRVIRRLTRPRPSHPAPDVRDDRDTPLVQGHETAAFMDLIWAKREGKYFWQKHWTRPQITASPRPG